MKNLLSTTLTSLIIVLFIATNVNAQDWITTQGYLHPNQDGAKLHLGTNTPFHTNVLSPWYGEEEGDYLMKLIGVGQYGNCLDGGVFTYTPEKPGLHAVSEYAPAVYAETGQFPAVHGKAGVINEGNFALCDWTNSENIPIGILGEGGIGVKGVAAGGYGYAGLFDGDVKVEDGDVKVENGDVKVENGHVIIGEEIDFAPNVDALLQVKTTAPFTYGIQAEADEAVAVGGTSTNASGVSGFSTNSYGVSGSSLNDIGVFGYSTLDIGIKGESETGMAILGSAANGIGVKGISGADYGGYFETVDGAAALYAYDRDGGGLAAHFQGNVKLNGSITGNVGSGAIKIETPEGYNTEIGPFNQWNSHFRTNRAQFYFYQKVRSAAAMYATGFHVTSDKRLKDNVSEFEYGLDEILQLNPLTYDYTGKGGTTSGDYNVGLFAQDLQKVAPEFVTEFTHREFKEDGEVKSEKDYLQVYDTGIKYMLVNATKEQQEIIDEQADRIETLEETLAELQATVETLMNGTRTTHTQTVELNGEEGALAQNQPNPFSNNTLIKYNVPENATNAVITIFNINGQKMHQERIRQTGAGEIQLQAKNLTAGTYSYTLTIDGNIIDSKQMVITK